MNSSGLSSPEHPGEHRHDLSDQALGPKDPSEREPQGPSTRRLSGKACAKLLGVSAAALSQSVKNEHYCGGYPCYWWADKSPSGRVAGYDVPEKVVRALENGGPRINPFSLDTSDQFEVEEEDGWTTVRAARAHKRKPAAEAPAEPSASSRQQASRQQDAEEPSSEEFSLKEAQETLRQLLAAQEASESATEESEEEQPARTEEKSAGESHSSGEGEWAGYQGTSLLPPGEDYSKSVAAGATGMVLQKAIEENNGTARALTLAASSGIGALFGAELAGKENCGTGGVLGALLGAGLTAWGLGLAEVSKTESALAASATPNGREETPQLSLPRAQGSLPGQDSRARSVEIQQQSVMRHRRGPRAVSDRSNPGRCKKSGRLS